MKEIIPLTFHSDLYIVPHAYVPDSDTLHIDVMPRSPAKWAETAYRFGSQNTKYDRSFRLFGIDGQPRVNFSGLVWVRYLSDFLDDSKVGMNIWSQQPSHYKAEEQLMKLYGLFQERDGLEPIEVFRKYS
jgi:hypothetical protein